MIGAGPAGLMAAEVLARAEVDVSVLDARRSPGNKFLLAGRSGLNLSHNEPLDELVGRYRDPSGLVGAAVRTFPPEAARAWADDLGARTFVGTSGRIFPEAMRSTGLLRSWLARLDQLGVQIVARSRWLGWDDHGMLRFETADDQRNMEAAATVLALGGASWPRTGSDGGWTATLQAIGIDVNPLVASNCGVTIDWSATMLDRFAGEPVKNIAIAATPAVEACPAVRGDVVITASGLEGGPIYALGHALRHGAELRIDLFPDLTTSALSQRLSRRRGGATVTSWLRSAGVSPAAVALLRDCTGNRFSEEPGELAALLRGLPLPATGLAPIERAISSAGGVAMDQLDSNFMIRDLPGVFAAGEMLDWDAPTGGYLLQGCLSTGAAAGRGVVDWLRR